MTRLLSPASRCAYVRTYVRTYRILSKNSSQIVVKKIRQLVAIRIGMKKMAVGDEYLDYLDETLE